MVSQWNLTAFHLIAVNFVLYEFAILFLIFLKRKIYVLEKRNKRRLRIGSDSLRPNDKEFERTRIRYKKKTFVFSRPVIFKNNYFSTWIRLNSTLIFPIFRCFQSVFL